MTLLVIYILCNNSRLCVAVLETLSILSGSNVEETISFPLKYLLVGKL